MIQRCKAIIRRFLVRLVIYLFDWIIDKLRINKADYEAVLSINKNAVARLILILINIFKVDKGDLTYFDYFEMWEKNGFHLTPAHFYQPIPNIQSLPESVFSRQSSMIGINMNVKVQVRFLNRIFPKYRNEYNRIPTKPTKNIADFYFNNGAFDGLDALVLYCIIRHFKPKTVVEVGSGWSTRIAAKACLKNRASKLISIEPYPYDFLTKGFPGLTQQIPKQIQEIDITFFDRLGKNDILFIDSSHTVKVGGDVNYLFLEVLPCLRKGVIVHVHDIFIPYEYPRNWIKKEYRFWNEQYLLQALLTNNNNIEILFANSYMGREYKRELKRVFPKSPSHSGGSIWLRKV
jgi:hypothetical protein